MREIIVVDSWGITITLLEVDSILVSWWIVAYLPSAPSLDYALHAFHTLPSGALTGITQLKFRYAMLNSYPMNRFMQTA